MKAMNTQKTVRPTAAITIALAIMVPSLAHAQNFDGRGLARTEALRHDLDTKTHAVQVRVDFAPGALAPKHSHPGVELAYVLQGTIEYELNGKTIRLKAGESLFIPAGAVHSAKNVDTGISAELATYMVEKNKPIVVLDK